MASHPPPEVLFICTGNYYRSRFSEALFNHLAQQNRSVWRAFSRGVDIDLAPPGLSPYTHDFLTERRIPLNLTTAERSPLTTADLERADRRIALKEAEHRAYLERDFPTWADRVEFWHFHDLDVATAHEMLPTLEKHVTAFYHAVTATDP